mmetsp:Transcript_12763/g.26607  ORF Transcript_12763/g.26607 Transcript_12763/m.26607 type:complete len:331 (-) Transcript_12763:75-1067(-)
MPVVNAGAAPDDIPLLNAADGCSNDGPPDSKDDAISLCSDVPSEPHNSDEEDARARLEPGEDGKFYDDPLWFGKTLADIRYATDLEKSNGNAASRDGDWKRANRYWKNALKGAEKIKDEGLELRLRLNLALGYTRRHKLEKALEHCDEVFKERLSCAASAELRAKAHYRRAEVYEMAGDTSKALRSLRAVLDIEPGNADARRKWTELKQTEKEQRSRERSLFHGKLPQTAVEAQPEGRLAEGSSQEAAEASSHIASSDAESTSSSEKQPPATLPRGCTDRAASARLFGGLGSRQRAASEDDDEPALNMDVGPTVNFFGPVHCSDSAKAEH